jgi:hypothetical protein
VQALRRGLEAVQEAGNLDQAPEVIQRLISVTDQLTDWRELMDVLRQIVQVPGVPPQWLESTITRSIASARLAYSKATNPATALSILMPAMRRMLHDLGRSNEIVTWWQDIGVAAHDWLWSEAEDFWQMLAIVMEAAQQQSARGLALEILNRYTTDTATPLVGRAWLAITHALHLWDIGSPSAAMQVVRVEMKGGDAHPLYAHGYYWEALVSLARGAEHDAHRNAEKCLKCIGQQMHHHWQWELVGKANLILAKFSEQCVLQLGLPFELSSLKALNVEITNDIKKLK